ncbi:MAG: flagellar hook-basal body complex protein FliE [Pseudomonadota bacterium]|nr:flagellar hook-basal body complex protein FliE [Pseudomonadota bacterium]
MSTIPTLTVSPSSAVNAYARVQDGALDAPSNATANGFGDVLARAIQGVADTGHKADAEPVKAISGQGNLTDVATAVTRAELSMQTALAIRDRVVQSYQEITRMQI